MAERGEEGIARVRDLTGSRGADRVIEAVGTEQALQAAFGSVTDGGAISRLGVPSTNWAPSARP